MTDRMELMSGNSRVIINPCPSTPEESEQAEKEMHMVMWEIAEALWEKGDKSVMIECCNECKPIPHIPS